MFNKKVVAKRLTELRQNEGKTQQEVANDLGISTSAVAMY